MLLISHTLHIHLWILNMKNSETQIFLFLRDNVLYLTEMLQFNVLYQSCQEN